MLSSLFNLPKRSVAAVVLTAALLAMPAQAQLLDPRSQPEASTGSDTHELATAKRHMVSAANAVAADAGREMLRAGRLGRRRGDRHAARAQPRRAAIVAASAAAPSFSIGTRPRPSSRPTTAARRRRPSARPDRFLVDGKPMPFDDAVLSAALSVGVPGVAARCSRRRTSSTASCRGRGCSSRRSASPRTASRSRRACICCCAWRGPASFVAGGAALLLRPRRQRLPRRPPAQEPGVRGHPARASRRRAPTPSTTGAIAQAIVDAVRAAPTAPGRHDARRPRRLRGEGARRRSASPTAADEFAAWGRRRRAASRWRRRSKLLEPFDLGTGPAAALEPQRAASDRRGREARLRRPQPLHRRSRLRAVPDGPARSPAISPSARALIDPLRRHADRPKPGDAAAAASASRSAPTRRVEAPGTSHISIVDDDGNAVSMTTTIEGGFGSRLWAAGFLLNNELTDFSFAPVDATAARRQRASGRGKRPRSSMAPTIVFDAQGKRRGRARARRAAAASSSTWSRRWSRCSTGGSTRSRPRRPHQLRQPGQRLRDRD